ncbi:MAG: hypothetical protein JWQ08_2584 [Deinococcus sp.]|nr:hypothetical protein [Deinococcus sp.]
MSTVLGAQFWTKFWPPTRHSGTHVNSWYPHC